ncbi:hypothetical protein QBC46DRAFT_391282 [Diplogelasinospora grovesii]|uniref:Uncharacterized protein n=1 Tax=Diplogelasinospora grovesii TaxID=303347 RepID=A0AAN6N553_9PEZI|nr:hypothetical protein QBC46DRAFT_391282 [Diplogelasinospora grovesii]
MNYPTQGGHVQVRSPAMDHRSDENLPEVVRNPSPTFPEVVVDPSPQALPNTGAEQQQRHLAEQEKYPAYFDDTPKFLHEQHNHDGNQRPRDNSATAYSPDGSALLWEPLRAGDDTTLGANSNSGANDEPKICGVRRRIFWLILAFALVVIATGVGGGVGGAVASARAREGSGTGNPATTSSSSGSLAPTSTTSSSSTSSSAPTPTFTTLNNQTGPQFQAFQGFSEIDFQGNATTVIQKEGFHDLGLAAKSYVWLPNDTGCCLTFCANKTAATGWWCEKRSQPKASGLFVRIYIWCGNHANNANETCS